jgi:hypothetical protein
MAGEEQERQLSELSLLCAMFPDEFSWQFPPGGTIDPELPDAELKASISLSGQSLFVIDIFGVLY